MGASVPNSKYFGIPFATSGDRAAIPEATQPSGAISFTQGFGPDYERDPATDPLAKRVPRDETNEYLYQITNVLRWLQLFGLPEWYDVDDSGNDVSYPLGARVRHNDLAWVSAAATNTTTPGAVGATWTQDETFNLALLEATVAEAQAQAIGTKIITPRRLGAVTATDTRRGLVELATIAEFTAGTDPDRALTPAVFAGGIASYLGGPPTTLWVRSDGNNANNGSANNAGSAFQTLQGAVDFITARFGAGKAVIIKIGLAGTYASPTQLPSLCNIEIQGDSFANRATYIINNAGAARSVFDVLSGFLKLRWVTITNVHAGAYGVAALVGGQIDLEEMKFGSSAAAFAACVRAAYGGRVRLATYVGFESNAGVAVQGLAGGVVTSVVGATWAFAGGPAYSIGTVDFRELASLTVSGTTITGAATGTRYITSTNSVISTGGAGANFFPGTVVGVANLGGLYT